VQQNEQAAREFELIELSGVYRASSHTGPQQWYCIGSEEEDRERSLWIRIHDPSHFHGNTVLEIQIVQGTGELFSFLSHRGCGKPTHTLV